MNNDARLLVRLPAADLGRLRVVAGRGGVSEFVRVLLRQALTGAGENGPVAATADPWAVPASAPVGVPERAASWAEMHDPLDDIA